VKVVVKEWFTSKKGVIKVDVNGWGLKCYIRMKENLLKDKKKKDHYQNNL
jgi:5'(3')-deoxyribonucleotidase